MCHRAIGLIQRFAASEYATSVHKRIMFRSVLLSQVLQSTLACGLLPGKTSTSGIVEEFITLQ